MALFSVDGLSVAIRRMAGPGPDTDGTQVKVKAGTVRRVAVDELLAIDDVSFHIDEGEALAMVGESGSGKSLIAMGAVDLLPFGAFVRGGRTTFQGQVLQEIEEADWQRLVGQGIGVLFQDAVASWNPIDIIGAQSAEVIERHEGLPWEEIQKRVTDALGEVQLPKRRTFLAWPHEMSQGQAQRAMLAAALLSAPQMLIADEPLSGLDVTVARAVLDLIDDMRRKRGMGMLLVTHDLAVVAAVADRVAVVYGGMIVEEAPAVDLYRTPRHPYTSGLLGAVPGLGRGRLRPIPGDTPDIWELPRGCPFSDRCEHVIDACREARPEPRPVGASMVACIRADELDLPGI
jgi:oligopeptide/dipeptide ABC transporter ATP-binding protein